jgi:ABC-type glycerol-3-phosphate transport system substrate-binding protein
MTPTISQEATRFLREAGRAFEGTRLHVLQYASPQSDAIRAVSDQFTRITGIDVTWTKLDEKAAATKASIDLGSGQGSFDLLQTSADLLPTYASRGWLASLTELGEDDDVAVPGWRPEAYGDAFVNLLSHDGQLYAAPMFLGTQIFYYRTDIFEQHNLSPPETFDDLERVCATIHGDPVSAIAVRTSAAPSQNLFVWSAWLYGMGGRYFTDYADGEYAGPALDRPEAFAAAEYYSRLVQRYAPTGATNWTVEDVVRAFASGQVAIVQEGAVFGGTFNDESSSRVAGKVGTFVIPAGPAGRFVPFTAHGWAIAQGSRHQKAAWLFAQWATLRDTLVSATQSDVNFAAPPLTDVYSSKPYQRKYGFDDYVKTVKDTIAIANAGNTSPLDGDPHYVPGLSNWSAVGLEISKQLSAVVTGQLSAENAMRRANDLVAKMIA